MLFWEGPKAHREAVHASLASGRPVAIIAWTRHETLADGTHFVTHAGYDIALGRCRKPATRIMPGFVGMRIALYRGGKMIVPASVAAADLGIKPESE